MTDVKVKIYALSTCPYCKRTIAFLKENGVNMDVVFIDELPKDKREKIISEVYELTGMYAVPVILYGDRVIVGFKEDELKKLVEEKNEFKH